MIFLMIYVHNHIFGIRFVADIQQEMKRKIAEQLLIKDTLIKPEKDPFLQDEDESEKDLLKE